MNLARRRRNLISISLGTLVCVLAFQNCGELRPSGSAVVNQASTEVRFRKDKATISRVLSSAKNKIWISAQESSIEVTSTRVTRVRPMLTNNVELSVPALQQGPAVVDSPTLGGKVFEFDAGSGLTSDSVDMPASTHYSIIALVEGPLAGRLMSMRTGSAQTSELALTYGSGSIKAVNYFDSTNFATLGDSLYVNAGPIVVAASWNEGRNLVSLQINGRVVNANVVETGVATDVGGSQRQFFVGGSSFRLAEAVTIAEALTNEELNSMSRYLADRWNFTGVIIDPTLDYSDSAGANPNVMPPEVKRIISSCQTSSCHSGWASQSLATFKTLGLIIPGDYLNSPVYYRLTGSEGSYDPAKKTMPQGSSLAASDVALLKQWIQNLK